MEEFRWIERAPTCTSCAHELEHNTKQTVKRIISERRKLPKCRYCERLSEIEESLKLNRK